MYRPKQWASLARQLAGFAATLNNSEADATSIQNIRSRIESSLEYTPLLNRRQDSTNTSDPTTDYANQAITCADAVDPGNTTTRDGFDAVVDITRRVTKIGKSAIFCTICVLTLALYSQLAPTRAGLW